MHRLEETHSECNSKANCFFSNKCEKITKCSDLKLLSSALAKEGNKIVTPSVMSRGAAVNCQWDFVSRKCAQFKDTVIHYIFGSKEAQQQEELHPERQPTHSKRNEKKS